MALLIEQLRKHCKAKGLHCMIFTEGEEEGKYAISGYFGDHLLGALVQHLMMWKPEVVGGAIEQLEAFASQPKEPEQPKSLIIEP